MRDQINDIDEEWKKVDSTLSEFCEVICTDYKSLVDSTDQMRLNMDKMRDEKVEAEDEVKVLKRKIKKSNH